MAVQSMTRKTKLFIFHKRYTQLVVRASAFSRETGVQIVVGSYQILHNGYIYCLLVYCQIDTLEGE